MPHVTTTAGPLGSAITASLHGPHGHIGILGVGFFGPIAAATGLQASNPSTHVAK